ncbi:ABC transporter ATP-binding protein [Hydrogenophaga sp.]|uniref:ABC transporter ATP-binding protein n=1 Tax=Hydrogenophaga sp. TaxID=1904254 RepID=UPI00272414EB|nr:dipeptide ABC transporter ATP-binding protein [Hydrogenophaga sp.]MDO9438480.1 dipeptide ABC transporter ATP-binding protein [Hydrogenophaga sp.]
MSLLDVQHLSVAFGDKTVVRDVSFSIAPGEKLALVGESGSGKSVTAMSLLGLVQGASVSGHAHFGARDLTKMQPGELREVRGQDIAVIFQEPMSALNPVYSVGFQIAEVLRIKRGVGRRAAWRQAVDRLRETGIPEPERRAHAYPHQLSGGQRQRAMIAMALACEPQLLLADEPTTALDVTLRLQILELLAELQRRNGMAVLLITHDLNLVRRFADRVAVMEQGVLVEQGETQSVFNQPVHPYTRKLIASRPERQVIAPPEEGNAGQAPWLESRGVKVSYAVKRTQPTWTNWWRREAFVAVRQADFCLRRGETIGVIGESGSGKSTLAKAVLGLVRFEGALHVDGQTWLDARRHGFAALKALRRHVQVVFQDPYSSLSPRLNVEQIVGEALEFHEPELSAAQRHARIVHTLSEVGLNEAQHPRLLSRFPHEFSGGQRQRLAIARALIIHPKVLVLDEPTSALDVTIQKQVLALLQRLQRDHGLSYFLITHDMDVVRAMAHQVLVMKDGDIVESGSLESVLDAPQHDYTRKLIAATGYGPTERVHSA